MKYSKEVLSKYSLTAYLNVTLSSHEKEDYRQEYLKTIENLTSNAKNLNIPFNGYGNYEFDIEYIKKEDARNEKLLDSIKSEKLINIKNSSSFLESDLLKIELHDIEVSNEIPYVVREQWKEFDSHMLEIIDQGKLESIEFNRAIIYEIFNKRIHDLIFAVNLSNFGSLTVNEYVIFQEDGVYIIGGSKMDYRIFFEARRNSIEWNYPQLVEIDIKSVWEWLIKRDDFLNGFSENATTRALINLLEITNSDVNMKLFRAVMGIEGLYTKGKSNLMEQVREKTQILLGPQNSFKKLYSNMYEFRSKFIHGTLDIPAKANIDFSNKLSQHSEDLNRATNFAILILGATIQRIIVRKWDGLKFDYLVSNSSETM